ncbi:hypothetical protein LCGC14_1109070 [marine sediment metagenome]|uniref:Uncharacterized protein n=1 Tax=marine sediment metagenome TaxID=412755 RepID=A0A0F9MC40_9ZZZZ|nr:MAG: hypothetical protein Lokiarch_24630 [Candidatus Lokiarchaeum sp. GC14_75]
MKVKMKQDFIIYSIQAIKHMKKADNLNLNKVS